MNVSQLIQICFRRRRNLWTCLNRRHPSPGQGRLLIRQMTSRDRGRVRNCTVDPNLEEEFVFVDSADMEDRPRQEDTDLPKPQISSAPPLFLQQRHLRTLECQLQARRAGAIQETGSDSLILFQDVDFPLDENLVTSKIKRKNAAATGVKGQHKMFGTPDADEPVSDTCCSGCGAVLHCTAVWAPGYLPSEKYKVLVQEGKLYSAICQRCHLLTHHHKALHLEVSRDQYRAVVQQIHPLRALVLLIVDLLDMPNSIVQDLPQLIGSNKHVVVLGNKIDLLPRDSSGYLRRIKHQLAQYCREAGFGSQVTDVHLISAKTGFGVEILISSLQRAWRYKGDVYLVGSANAGKSTLFNTLLDSDYSKSKSAQAIRKATISPWPGTTLDLLKFPIINPTPYRMFQRQERLKGAELTQDKPSAEELSHLRHLSKHGYLVGRVGRTFCSSVRSRSDEIQFDPNSLAFGDDGDEKTTGSIEKPVEFSHNELKDAHWLYDTPGLMKDNDILSLLSEQEVALVVPTSVIVPQTFCLKPGMTLFVGGVARIDFLQGPTSCWFSVVASNRIPVHITSLTKADHLYQKHAGHALLGVPAGGPERMKAFPQLVPQEIKLKGRCLTEATADITLSSAGWVAVTAGEGDEVALLVHGPDSVSYGIRMPPLLPHVVSLRGRRVPKSAAYRTLKPLGPMDPGRTVRGTNRK